MLKDINDLVILPLVPVLVYDFIPTF
jgi:hypothetical protein